MPRFVRVLAALQCAAGLGSAAAQRPSADQRATAALDEIAKLRDSRVAPAALRRAIHEPRRIFPACSRSGRAGAASLPLNAPPAASAAYTGFPGILDNFTAIPPDTTGAVGPQHVVTMLTTQVDIQSRTGAPGQARPE